MQDGRPATVLDRSLIVRVRAPHHEGREWKGRTLIDTTNDFELGDMNGRTSSEVVAALVAGARVVKAANTLGAAVLGSDPHEGAGRRVIVLSGDDDGAKSDVITLFAEAGFGGRSMPGAGRDASA